MAGCIIIPLVVGIAWLVLSSAASVAFDGSARGDNRWVALICGVIPAGLVLGGLVWLAAAGAFDEAGSGRR
jgi:hypothetical protein